MKRYFAGGASLILSIALLASCGGKAATPSVSPSPTKSITLAPPADCATTKVLTTMQSEIKGAAWINTEWQPAPGTDLESIYNVGGIACSYGLASAEVGGTFSWARDTNGLFASRVKGWLASGLAKVSIPGISATESYAITDAARAKMEIPSYSANILVNGFWIQIGGAFIQNSTQAATYLQAAIGSLISTTPSITGCYIGKLAKDIYYLDIKSQNDNRISASIFYNTFEKDDSSGTLDGIYTNGIVNGMYTFQSEGSTSVRELFFKGDASKFVAGYGPPDSVNGEKFARPLSITWDKQFAFLPATDCLNK